MIVPLILESAGYLLSVSNIHCSFITLFIEHSLKNKLKVKELAIMQVFYWGKSTENPAARLFVKYDFQYSQAHYGCQHSIF